MRLVMMGTGTFAEPTFEAILGSNHQVVGLVTQPDRQTGEKRGSTRQVGKGMKEIALERGVPVFQPESINTPEGVERLTSWQPDLLVVAAYGQILSKDVLATAKLGGINVHASLLPKYRGAAPINWAIYHGEKETGVTIIRMSAALDAGDMLAQGSLDIGRAETAGELEARLAPLGARLAIDVIDRMESGPVAGIPQDRSKATKAPKLTKQDGLIDWSRHSIEVCDQIRAMQPWPTAFTYLWRSSHKDPIRVIIHQAWPLHADDFDNLTPLEPGRFDTERRMLVAAGQLSRVEIVELQPVGKRRMSFHDFQQGHDLKGARFGPAPAARDDTSAQQ